MVDASHANSSKQPNRQPLVVDDIAAQVEGGEATDRRRDDREPSRRGPPGPRGRCSRCATGRASPTVASIGRRRSRRCLGWRTRCACGGAAGRTRRRSAREECGRSQPAFNSSAAAPLSRGTRSKSMRCRRAPPAAQSPLRRAGTAGSTARRRQPNRESNAARCSARG